MEPLTGILSKVGLDLETCLAAATAVWLVTEWVKRKFPIQGIGTQIAAGILSCAIAALLMLPNWPGAVTLAVVAWFLPDTVHQARVNTQNKNDHSS